MDVMDGVSQRSVLHPQLFTIYINDLEEGTKCQISMFADDTKMDGKAYCDEAIVILQCNVDGWRGWAETW